MIRFRASNRVVFYAIASTLFWGLIYFSLIYSDTFIILSPFSSFVSLILLLALHPLIGKLWSLLVEFLCDAIDKVYDVHEINRWGDWQQWKRIMFAAWWPIAGPLGLIVTIIVLLYGAMYRGLFK